MKRILIALLILPITMMAGNLGPGAEKNGSEGNTKLSLYIPGFLMHAASWFVSANEEPEVKEFLKNIRSISLCVREGGAYHEYFTGKYQRKMEKLEKQNFEQLLTVADDEEKVTIQLRENDKGNIRQLVIMVDDGQSEFVFIRLRCSISINDIQRWIKSSEFCSDKLDSLIDI